MYLLASALAHAALVPGDDHLVMFRKGKANLAIIHTAGSDAFTFAKWVVGFLQLAFAAWVVGVIWCILACNVQHMQGVLNVIAYLTIRYVLYIVMERSKSTPHQMLGMTVTKIS